MSVLVKYDSNWADEMDVSGFRIFTEEEYKNWKLGWKEHFEEEEEYTYYVGTNEEIPYDDLEELMRDFEVSEITEEEAATISRALLNGGRSYGFFPG